MHEAYIMYDVESVTIQLKGSSWISISYYLLRTGLHSSGLARAAIEGWLFIIYHFKNRNSFPFRHATRTNIWITIKQHGYLATTCTHYNHGNHDNHGNCRLIIITGQGEAWNPATFARAIATFVIGICCCPASFVRYNIKQMSGHCWEGLCCGYMLLR